MKKLFFYVLLSLTILSCKKEEIEPTVETCTPFENEIYTDVFQNENKIVGDWTGTEYNSNCQEDEGSSNISLYIFFDTNTGQYMEQLTQQFGDWAPVIFHGDELEFTSTGITYEIYKLDFNEMILGTPDEKIIRYTK